MPTPFMHLHMAEQMVRHPALPAGVRQLLVAHWPAFYLGNVAPDFQVICDVPRETTHCYPIPPEPGDTAAFPRLLAAHPHLADASQLDPAQAVFWAGYGAHLRYDLVWDGAVLTPHFRNGTWGDRHGRFLAHNTLLSYMDTAAVAELPPTAAATLHQAPTPHDWLPFDPQHKLQEWQTLLAAQLLPGAAIRTVEIYAERMRITPAQFAAQLADPAWMAAQVFSHIALAEVQTAVQTALEESVTVITDYLSTSSQKFSKVRRTSKSASHLGDSVLSAKEIK